MEMLRAKKAGRYFINTWGGVADYDHFETLRRRPWEGDDDDDDAGAGNAGLAA